MRKQSGYGGFYYVPLAFGVGGMLGLMLGLVSDFSIFSMAAAIRNNPDVFMKQYLNLLLLFMLIVCAGGAIAGIRSLFVFVKRRPIPRAEPAAHQS